MDPITTVLTLMLAVAVFALLASKIGIPYPTMMVIGGLAICTAAFIFGSERLREFELPPRLIFTLFLPPLLYGAAWQTSWKDLRTYKRQMLMLAVGLVFFTTAGVAILVMRFIPGFTWPTAFALGAIVSPPDAIAVTALTRGLRLPRRVVVILEGESLVNDASALVALKFAVAAAMTGTFSIWHASGEFFLVATGGIFLGLLIGWVVTQLHRRLNDFHIETVITFLTPYAAYLLGEMVGVSGVLATVVAGVFVSWKAPQVLSPAVRLRATAVWEFVLFLLNSFVFVLLGLGLPVVIRDLPDHSVGSLAGYGFLLVAGMVGLRMTWVFIGAYAPFSLRLLGKNERPPPVKQVALIGWTGMRGVVSLAAALALPLEIGDGERFPNRGLIIYLTFFAIIFTLVFQSVTLPWVVRMLGIGADESEAVEEHEARVYALRAAAGFLRDLTESTDAFGEVGRELQQEFEQRLRRMEEGEALPLESAGIELTGLDLRREVLSAERQALVELRARQKISIEAFGRLMGEVDAEELQLPPRG